MSEEPVRLLSDPSLDDGAEPTHRRVVDLLREAGRSVEIRMFVWRSDATGNRIAREVLAAADRGVRVRIHKDVGAFMYERLEMNRKSLFDRPVSAWRRLYWRLVARNLPESFVEDGFDASLGRALLAHPNVSLEWVDHTHTKCWVFDERTVLLGSINLEDRHRGYRDYMAEIRGEEHVSRLRERADGRAPVDPDRAVEFVLNRRIGRTRVFEIKAEILRLLGGARRSAYLEMAYYGDPDVSRAIVEAARRGVAVTILFSREANIGNDLNYRTLHWIARRAGVRVILSDRVVHAKLLMTDDETVLLGSANLSIYSLRKAAEMDVRVQGLPGFLAQVREEAARRIRAGEPADSPDRFASYGRVSSALQQLHQRLS